jgi:hypothetical protein
MALRELRLRAPRSLIIEIVALPPPLRGAAEGRSLLRDLLPDRPCAPYPSREKQGNAREKLRPPGSLAHENRQFRSHLPEQ